MADLNFKADNHFVPRLYLNLWADAEQQIVMHRLLVSHPNVPLWEPKSTRSVAHHQHLYTQVVDSTESDEFERWIGEEFETPAEDAIQRVISGAQLSPQHWRRLIRFVAAQDVRTPSSLIQMLERSHESLPSILQATVERIVQDFEEARRTKMPLATGHPTSAYPFPMKITPLREPGAESGHLKIEVSAGRSLWLFQMRKLLTDTVGVLLKRRWTVLRAPPGLEWVTSDNPVVRLNYYEKGNYNFNGGWGQPGTEIMMPLGPGHLIYTKVSATNTESRQYPRNYELAFDAARELQRIIIERARWFIFASIADPEVHVVRPRIVDAARYKNETEQWQRWHEEQSASERDIFAPRA